jgi:flavorubredoxin
MDCIKIRDNIYWVGVLDPEMRIFDIVFKTDQGTTYNSYLIKDKKTALIDTVKKPFTAEFISNLKSQIDLKDIDYIIVNHTEPDHSGALSELLKYAGNAKVMVSKSGGHLLKNIINVPVDLTIIEDNTVVDLGGCELRFIICTIFTLALILFGPIWRRKRFFLRAMHLVHIFVMKECLMI